MSVDTNCHKKRPLNPTQTVKSLNNAANIKKEDAEEKKKEVNEKKKEANKKREKAKEKREVAKEKKELAEALTKSIWTFPHKLFAKVHTATDSEKKMALEKLYKAADDDARKQWKKVEPKWEEVKEAEAEAEKAEAEAKNAEKAEAEAEAEAEKAEAEANAWEEAMKMAWKNAYELPNISKLSLIDNNTPNPQSRSKNQGSQGSNTKSKLPRLKGGKKHRKTRRKTRRKRLR
jgi:membrane protein involved in colicin uptake